MRIWTITDGKAGDLAQCQGVAEGVAASLALPAEAVAIEARTVRPGAPFVWLMPWGPVDPRDREPLAPPFPDLAIASGRRAVPYVRRLKRLSPRTLTVFLKDPRSGRRAADLVWVPEHDRLRGDNVLVTLTSPHRMTPERLRLARAGARADILALGRPRVAVLVGGPSKDVAFTARDVEAFCDRLDMLASGGAGLMVTASRRTPASLSDRIAAILSGRQAFLWDGTGENPYGEMLATADAFVVTAESVNMVGEAVATGRPVHVFEPEGLSPKVRRFLDGLERHGAVTKFEGRLENLSYQPLDSTPLIAQEVVRRLQRACQR
jgi:mitochondrial fission protein ELM1